ncbi:hypothetical protein F4818DRAFT_439347 [Hypoxylon cercidicola]|nr:hypothetical protein F4818DRAFT_439347 [Hypoxylon cercidicola]
MTSVYVAGISSPCQNNQPLISNGKCCPGYSIVDSDGTFCCVTDPNWTYSDVSLCFDGNCKAKVSIDDPNYDQRVSDPQGTASSPTSSAAISTASSASGSATFSDTASGSSTTTDSAATSSETAAAASDNAAAGTREATFGMVAALAAVPVAFYVL